MRRKFQILTVMVVIAASCATAMAATFRSGGDPTYDRIIWADSFDMYYSDAANPNGVALWPGGPTPAGVTPASLIPNRPTDCAFTADWTLAQTNWVPVDGACPAIVSPRGVAGAAGVFQANQDQHCGLSGEIVVTGKEFGEVDNTWGQGGWYTSMNQFMFNLKPRIQQVSQNRGDWVDPPTNTIPKNCINGTDAHPLVVIFYLGDLGTAGTNARDLFDNSYVELSLGHGAEATAPTDYIWRGTNSAGCPGYNVNQCPDVEACPQGPYPIICQQVRTDLNTGNSNEEVEPLPTATPPGMGDPRDYVNSHCPAVIPPYDPSTNTGKTWRSFAFGYLAMLDKNPCGFNHDGSSAHKPTMNHFAVFDGNIWREMRSGRFPGMDLTNWNTTAAGFPFPWDPYMTPPAWPVPTSPPSQGGNFSFQGGTNRVVLKITSHYVLMFVTTNIPTPGGTPASQVFQAAIPRVYEGPFDTIRWGVAKGCELDPATGLCKNNAPRTCMTYSTASAGVGYDRTFMDAMLMIDGELQFAEYNKGACCQSDGTCALTLPSACTGTFNGLATTCQSGTCQGACCGPQNTCTNTTQNGCAAGSAFRGMGTSCAGVNACPCSVHAPTVDYNWDNSVDMDDFAALQRCLTIPAGTVIQAGCACFDRDVTGASNGKIDSADAERFANCATGKGVPWVASTGCPN